MIFFNFSRMRCFLLFTATCEIPSNLAISRSVIFSKNTFVIISSSSAVSCCKAICNFSRSIFISTSHSTLLLSYENCIELSSISLLRESSRLGTISLILPSFSLITRSVFRSFFKIVHFSLTFNISGVDFVCHFNKMTVYP